jgi:hypothetical protein
MDWNTKALSQISNSKMKMIPFFNCNLIVPKDTFGLKKLLLLTVLILNFIPSFLTAQSNHKYFIRFTEKDSTLFSVNFPEEFLSARAIERRQKQGISISPQDFPVSQAYVNAVVAQGAIVFTSSKWFNGITIECDSSVLNAVMSLPFVVSSKKIFRYGVVSHKKKLSNGLPLSQISMMRIQGEDYGGSFNQINLMQGDFLHDAGYTGNGMLVAVLDAGFYSVDQLPVFDAIRQNNKIVATWDFVEGSESVYEDDTHGMAVLSTLAGYLPGSLIGTSPDASYLLLRSEDAGNENIIEEYNWAAAAEYADSAGADVISSSLGYTTFDDSTFDHTYADMDGDHCPSTIAADIAASKGLLVVNSAGNSGNSAWHYIGAPSDGDSVISVGAVDFMGRYVYFSSFGPSYDGDVKPNVAAKGFQSTIANAFGGISKGNGTSFSCPILAGSATCLWQAHPEKTAMEIKIAIERSANSYLSPNDSLGFGIPDFRLASYLLSTGNRALPIQDELLGVYPNPFTETINVRYYSSTSGQIKIEIINSIGQVVYEKEESAVAGYVSVFSITTDATNASGLYFVRIVSGDETFVEKAVRN